MRKFDYAKAESDLYEMGCHHSEEIYEHKTERAIKNLMQEYELNPEKYYKDTDPKGSKGNNTNNSGCYLTSACVNARNLPDDCDELQTLRTYRDIYLKDREGGAEDIAHYYRVAPQIVARIDARQDAGDIWNGLYDSMVVPCVKLIKGAKMEAAYELYKDRTTQLEKEYLG